MIARIPVDASTRLTTSPIHCQTAWPNQRVRAHDGIQRFGIIQPAW